MNVTVYLFTTFDPDSAEGNTRICNSYKQAVQLKRECRLAGLLVGRVIKVSVPMPTASTGGGSGL